MLADLPAFAKSELAYKEARPQKDLDRADLEDEFSYSPLGKVDPFQPFFLEEEVSIAGGEAGGGEMDGDAGLEARMQRILEKLREPKTELQRYSLSELTVTAIVKTGDEVKAMVTDPEGRGFVLEKGTYIGKMGGVVDQIQCEEQKGEFGRESVRKIVIKEPFFNRDRKLDYKYREMELPFKGVYK
jgi:Tfp pilus assembly protein PilP